MGKVCAFTIVRDESLRLPLWLRHYAKLVESPADDLYVLDNGWGECPADVSPNDATVIARPSEFAFNHAWLRDTVQSFAVQLHLKYDVVIFAEVDEFLLFDPLLLGPHGISGLLDVRGVDHLRARGYDLLHEFGEPAIDWNKPLLPQRTFWAESALYSKTLVNRKPVSWSLGFHTCDASAPEPDDGLILVHTHRADFDTALARHRKSASMNWSPEEKASGRGHQNAIDKEQVIRDWCGGYYNLTEPQVRSKIPDAFKQSGF